MCWLCRKRPATRQWTFPEGEEGVCDLCFEAMEWFTANRDRLRPEDLAKRLAELEQKETGS